MSKPWIAMWTEFQKQTGQLSRPPDAVERELMEAWEARTVGDHTPVLRGIKKTASWRAARGFTFRRLDQAATTVRIEIDGWLKGQAVVPEIARLTACVGTVTGCGEEHKAAKPSRGMTDGWTPEQIAAAQRIAMRNRGEDA